MGEEAQEEEEEEASSRARVSITVDADLPLSSPSLVCPQLCAALSLIVLQLLAPCVVRTTGQHFSRGSCQSFSTQIPLQVRGLRTLVVAYGQRLCVCRVRHQHARADAFVNLDFLRDPGKIGFIAIFTLVFQRAPLFGVLVA